MNSESAVGLAREALILHTSLQGWIFVPKCDTEFLILGDARVGVTGSHYSSNDTAPVPVS